MEYVLIIIFKSILKWYSAFHKSTHETFSQLFGASFTGDIGEAITHVSSCYPDANLYAAGWSLGANILEGDRCLLSGAVSLCNPFNVVLAVEELHKGFNKVYDRILRASLSKLFSRHALLFEGIEGDYNILMNHTRAAPILYYLNRIIMEAHF